MGNLRISLDDTSRGSLSKEAEMSAPFVTLTIATIADGKFEEFQAAMSQSVELVKEREPRVIAFNVMADKDRKRMLGMQVHPDAASMEFHLQVMREAITQIGSLLTIEEFKVLGPSSPVIDGLLTSMVESGAAVEHLPHHVAGFTRSSAAQ